MLFQYFYRTSPVRGNPEQRIESLVPHSTDVADRKFTPAAPNPPAVSVPRATALFVRTPDRSRSATQAGVGALHTTPQYIFHRFILSPHAFPLAIFMHRTVANLLLATVYPTNQHCNICFRYTQLVEFDPSKSFQQHMCLAVWINLCRFLKRKCFRIGSPRYQLIDFSTTNTEGWFITGLYMVLLVLQQGRSTHGTFRVSWGSYVITRSSTKWHA